MVSSTDIAQRIIEAILAQRLAPGARLGEQALSMLFDCSRTQVREALMRLAAKGIVTVSSRRGWYVMQPSHEEALQAEEHDKGHERLHERCRREQVIGVVEVSRKVRYPNGCWR